MVYKAQSVKFDLPNGHTADLLYPQIKEMMHFKQDCFDSPESCGFLMGYQNLTTDNITISEITIPQKNDICNRFLCILKDAFHFKSLQEGMERRKNYYIGAWHTHPQAIPEPSSTDWNEWNDTLAKDRSGVNYFFFAILGTKEFRIWVGDQKTNLITEIFEAKQIDGIYERK